MWFSDQREENIPQKTSKLRINLDFYSTLDKAIQHLCDCCLSSWYWHSGISRGKQDKGKHLFSIQYTLKPFDAPFLNGCALFSSFLATRDQINLRDFRGLSARPSGQSHSSGCSGETRVPPSRLDLWAVCLSDNQSVWPLQQGNFNSSVGPDGYMLAAVTCGMSPVTSITEGLQQVPVSKPVWPCEFWFFCDWLIPSLPRRSSPWGYSAPSRCSTWGVLTASCDAAWFRGSSRKQPTSGNSSDPTVFTGRHPSSSSVPHPATQLVHNCRWGGKEASLWMHFWCHLNCGRCLLYACLLM